MIDNNEQQLITPHEAAAMIEIGVHNVRRWCEWHADHLSAFANPGSGATRRLTVRDISVLRTVKALRDRGKQTASINDILERTAFADVDNSVQTVTVESPLAVQESPSDAIAPVAMIIQALQTVTAPLEARVAAQDERIKAMERNRRDVWVAFAVGVIVAGVFFLIIVLLIRPG